MQTVKEYFEQLKVHENIVCVIRVYQAGFSGDPLYCSGNVSPKWTYMDDQQMRDNIQDPDDAYCYEHRSQYNNLYPDKLKPFKKYYNYVVKSFSLDVDPANLVVISHGLADEDNPIGEPFSFHWGHEAEEYRQQGYIPDLVHNVLLITLYIDIPTN